MKAFVTCLFLSLLTLYFHCISSFIRLTLFSHFKFIFIAQPLNIIHVLSHPINFTLPLAFLFLLHTFHLSLGQGGEPGTGPPALEQPPGRWLSAQAAARPVYRDLCPGYWQSAAQPVSGGFVCSGLPIPPGSAAALCDHLPPGGSRGRKDTGRSRRQDLASASQQCHNALYSMQAQSAKRGTLPAESSQDTHANVLPTDSRRTHPRGRRRQPRDIHLSKPNIHRHLSSKWRVESQTECQLWKSINKNTKTGFLWPTLKKSVTLTLHCTYL